MLNLLSTSYKPHLTLRTPPQLFVARALVVSHQLLPPAISGTRAHTKPHPGPRCRLPDFGTYLRPAIEPRKNSCDPERQPKHPSPPISTSTSTSKTPTETSRIPLQNARRPTFPTIATVSDRVSRYPSNPPAFSSSCTVFHAPSVPPTLIPLRDPRPSRLEPAAHRRSAHETLLFQRRDNRDCPLKDSAIEDSVAFQYRQYRRPNGCPSPSLGPLDPPPATNLVVRAQFGAPYLESTKFHHDGSSRLQSKGYGSVQRSTVSLL